MSGRKKSSVKDWVLTILGLATMGGLVWIIFSAFIYTKYRSEVLEERGVEVVGFVVDCQLGLRANHVEIRYEYEGIFYSESFMSPPCKRFVGEYVTVILDPQDPEVAIPKISDINK